MNKIFKKILIYIYIVISVLFVFIFNSCGLISSLTSSDTELENDTDSEITASDTEPINLTTTLELSAPEPVDITQEPEETIADTPPTTVALGQDISASGTIKSNSNHLIKLHIDWKVTQTQDNEYAELEVIVYLNCYAITIGARTNSTLTIDNETIEFATDKIVNENNSMTTIQLYTVSRQIYNPAGEEINYVEVAASFYFGGSYGGESIGWLETSGEIILTNDDTLIYDIIDDVDRNPLAPGLPDDPFEAIAE